MKRIRAKQMKNEPMGIVISSGAMAEEAPRFSAYVWGPAPETGFETPEAEAA